MKSAPYINSTLSKRIFIILGITGGYQFKLSERWNMDIYAGIGTSDFYKGYDRGDRYDSV
jgi:hypothetical protein